MKILPYNGQFFTTVRLAMLALVVNKIRLGNVDFYFEGGTLYYKQPTPKWKLEDINRDLCHSMLIVSACNQWN